jgi:hypothetical protein
MRTALRVLIVAAGLAGAGFVAFGGASGAEANPAGQTPDRDRKLDEFVPTEEIPPGSEVSFPVDI